MYKDSIVYLKNFLVKSVNYIVCKFTVNVELTEFYIAMRNISSLKFVFTLQNYLF